MIYDVIIIGSGPAGLTAALYTSRDNLKTLLIGGGKWGGQLMLTTIVENFPGFVDGIQGPDLMEAMRKQTERFGTEIKLTDVTKVDFTGMPFKVWSSEEEFQGKTVIIATGADTMWLGLANEQRLIGHGVSSCAPCDAPFFKGKNVVVVGGGDSAMEEALTLSKFVSNVIIVHRRDSFRASKIMQDRVLALPNVKVIWNGEIVDVLGQDKVAGVRIRDTVNKQERDVAVDGVFVAIGHIPNTNLFAGRLELDGKGYVKKVWHPKNEIRNEDGVVMGHKYNMTTSVDGVFVAGDVHDFHYRQAVTAAGFGCMAAMDVIKFLTGEAVISH